MAKTLSMVKAWKNRSTTIMDGNLRQFVGAILTRGVSDGLSHHQGVTTPLSPTGFVAAIFS